MSVEREPDPAEELYTVDELAAATGMTVRTTRYYAGLGLLPPPTRRGRMAYYTQEHRARLELIRALQDHGFTLSAIEKYLGRVPADASVEDLALQRAMLTSWGAGKRESVTRRQLETRARRKLDDDELQRLVNIYAIRRRRRPLRAAAVLRRRAQAARARHPGRLDGGGGRGDQPAHGRRSPTS